MVEEGLMRDWCCIDYQQRLRVVEVQSCTALVED